MYSYISLYTAFACHLDFTDWVMVEKKLGVVLVVKIIMGKFAFAVVQFN